MTWNAKKLNEFIKKKLKKYNLIVVSDREPYSKIVIGKKTKWIKPASGLVTAVEPIISAVSGKWIARGTTGEEKLLRVPIENPKYLLKRVFITKEDEEGYYYGFSNSALWPLSHRAYVPPIFRANDFESYKKVNKIFAEEVLQEIEGDTIIWIHDYHLTLCSKFIKEKCKDVITAFFWHIPWRDPEAFKICPWKEEILEGMLSNDIIGFQVRRHRENFLNTIDFVLEANVLRESSSVRYKGNISAVRTFPISIDFKNISDKCKEKEIVSKAKEIREGQEVPFKILAIGIERIDYIKGVIQKLQAIDRFIEKYPDYKEKFLFIELGVRSRGHLTEYKDLLDKIENLVEQINWKHKTEKWYPIVFNDELKDYYTTLTYLSTADICIVSSLHDGMNLVAKEYVAVKNNKDGILILSEFTGSSRELKESIIINPWDSDGFADAIKKAIEMPKKEKIGRMRKMRKHLNEENVYKWAYEWFSQIIRIVERGI